MISGSFAVAAGANLSVSGAGVTFIASGVAQIDGASFYASGGAVVSAPAARSYAKPACGYYGYWQASGAGSRIVLAGLMNVASSPFNCGGYPL